MNQSERLAVMEEKIKTMNKLLRINLAILAAHVGFPLVPLVTAW